MEGDLEVVGAIPTGEIGAMHPDLPEYLSSMMIVVPDLPLECREVGD